MGDRETVGDWPNFSIPSVDAGGSAPAEPVTPEPGGTPPPAPAVAAQPGAPAPSAPAPGEPTPEMLPKYRYDELRTQYDATTKQVSQLTALLERALAIQQAPSAPGEPLDPRKERIKQELIEAIPGIADALDLAKQRQQITAALAKIDTIEKQLSGQQAENNAAWGAYAKRSIDAVHDGLAPVLLGKGKTAKDLDAARGPMITNEFVRWIGLEPTRIERYNAQDPALRDEFVKAFVALWVDPVRRGSSAELARGARSVQHLPVQGGQANVLGTPPAKPNNEDEDAVYKRAWALAQSLRDS